MNPEPADQEGKAPFEQGLQAFEHKDVAANAADAGLGYPAEGRDHGDTFDIHRVLHFAKTRGKQDELLDLAYAANFAEERSVFDDERLVELAVAAGFDETGVRTVVADETAFAADVRADEQEAWAAQAPALKVVSATAPDGAVCGADGCEIP